MNIFDLPQHLEPKFQIGQTVSFFDTYSHNPYEKALGIATITAIFIKFGRELACNADGSKRPIQHRIVYKLSGYSLILAESELTLWGTL